MSLSSGFRDRQILSFSGTANAMSQTLFSSELMHAPLKLGRVVFSCPAGTAIDFRIFVIPFVPTAIVDITVNAEDLISSSSQANFITCFGYEITFELDKIIEKQPFAIAIIAINANQDNVPINAIVELNTLDNMAMLETQRFTNNFMMACEINRLAPSLGLTDKLKKLWSDFCDSTDFGKNWKNPKDPKNDFSLIYVPGHRPDLLK